MVSGSVGLRGQIGGIGRWEALSRIFSKWGPRRVLSSCPARWVGTVTLVAIPAFIICWVARVRTTKLRR